MSGLVAGSLIGGVGGIGSDLINYYGGMQASHRQRQFIREMSSTQYQRAVHDMRQAGLNPNAIFGSGGGQPAAAMQGGQDPAPSLEGARRGAEFGAQLAIQRSTARQAEANADLAVAESSAYRKALENPLGEAAAVQQRYGWAGSAASLLAQGQGNVFGGQSGAKGFFLGTDERKQEITDRKRDEEAAIEIARQRHRGALKDRSAEWDEAQDRGRRDQDEDVGSILDMENAAINSARTKHFLAQQEEGERRAREYNEEVRRKYGPRKGERR